MTSPTKAQLFAIAGATLYGPHWTQPMAAMLGWPLDERGQNRTIQRIKAAAERGEDYRIAPGVWRDIAKTATDQAAALKSMAATLRGLADDEPGD